MFIFTTRWLRPTQARERFREYINTLNALHENPRWYNAVTSNCTTSIRTQRAAKLRAPWDWRILLNGKADEMLYQDHAIATGGLPFTELKQRSLINERARVCGPESVGIVAWIQFCYAGARHEHAANFWLRRQTQSARQRAGRSCYLSFTRYKRGPVAARVCPASDRGAS